MFYIPIIAGLALATGTIIEKRILNKKKVSAGFYETVGFMALVLVMIPFIFFFWKIDPVALSLKNILIFLAVVIFSVLANYFTLNALKKGKLSILQPARITEPFFVIILAIIFSFIFSKELFERNTKIIFLAIVAGIALIFPHIKRHHLKFKKYFLLALLGSFFFAMELVVSRLILDHYNGLTFYFLRCIFVAFISLILFRPTIVKTLDKKMSIHILFVSLIWVGYRLLLYYGYTNLGVIETTLMVMLGPVFVYLFAWRFLHDRPTWKNIVSTIIILLCVIFVTLF